MYTCTIYNVLTSNGDIVNHGRGKVEGNVVRSLNDGHSVMFFFIVSWQSTSEYELRVRVCVEPRDLSDRAAALLSRAFGEREGEIEGERERQGGEREREGEREGREKK